MINYVLHELFISLRSLEHEITNAEMQNRNLLVNAEDHYRIKNNVRNAILPAISKLQMADSRIACVNLQRMIDIYERTPYNHGDLASALKRVRDDLLEGAKSVYFFHYPETNISLLHPVFEGYKATGEWQQIIDKFPSAKREIEAGLDCYALQDLPGCVFHMMRIVELGLRAIARERGIKSVGGAKKPKPLEWGTWNEVCISIRDEINKLHQKPAGRKRDEATAFYGSALDKIRFMQSLYRDPTVHFRERYEHGEAFDAINNSFSLMRTLASKLNENHPFKKINWGF